MDKRCSTYTEDTTSILCSTISAKGFPQNYKQLCSPEASTWRGSGGVMSGTWCLPTATGSHQAAPEVKLCKKFIHKETSSRKDLNRVHLHQLLLEAVECQCCKKKFSARHQGAQCHCSIGPARRSGDSVIQYPRGARACGFFFTRSRFYRSQIKERPRSSIAWPGQAGRIPSGPLSNHWEEKENRIPGFFYFSPVEEEKGIHGFFLQGQHDPHSFPL
jgi:hypothetical protein